MKINKENKDLLIAIKEIIKNKKLDENLIFNDYEDEKKIFNITDTIQDIIDIDTHFATMLILLALISINYDKLLNHIKNNRNNQIDAERIFNVVGFCLEWLDVDFNITENDVDDIIDTLKR